jgi:hypothetical protein
MSYSPNQKKYVTIAQTRTNDGQKDIKFIYDTEADTFHVLDENGVFTDLQTGDNPTLAGLTLTGTAEFEQNATFQKAIIVRTLSNNESGASRDLNSDTLSNNQVQINGNNGMLIFMNGDTGELTLGNYNTSPESSIIIDNVGIKILPTSTDGNRYLQVALPTFDNNAAAVAGGLPADYLYKTPGGDIKIVV